MLEFWHLSFRRILSRWKELKLVLPLKPNDFTSTVYWPFPSRPYGGVA